MGQSLCKLHFQNLLKDLIIIMSKLDCELTLLMIECGYPIIVPSNPKMMLKMCYSSVGRDLSDSHCELFYKLFTLLLIKLKGTFIPLPFFLHDSIFIMVKNKDN